MCTTSAQRVRRWSDIVQMLLTCFVFTGLTSQMIHLCRQTTGVYPLYMYECLNIYDLSDDFLSGEPGSSDV